MSQNRYEVLGKIADGGLGSVFKAYDRNLRREVALKRVKADSPEEAERQADQLFEEARTLSTLQHPHIVTIFDVGKDEEGAYIVMELLKGETLEDIIQRGALNEHDFRELVTQSLEGMIAAHASGLIHLDIKPQNFMVIWLPSGKFQIKILDFGLAKLTSQPTVQDVDDDGAIMGSIFFMSPEQFERSPVDARTDLYALGCVYYYALTQHYPFQGETGPEVMASHMYHSLIPLAQLRPDLPPFFHQWVEWLIARVPDHRPASAAQAFEYLQLGYFPAPPQEEAPPEQEWVEGEEIPTAIPTPDIPQPHYPSAPPIVRPGTATSPLRPTAPRPTRPVPTITRGVPTHRPPGSVTLGLSHKPAPKPLAKPINIAAAAAPKHLQHKDPLPKWLTLWTPLGIVLIIALIFGMSAMNKAKREARLNELAQAEQPQGTAIDVQMLFEMLEQPETSEPAGKALGKLQGMESLDSKLASQVPAVKSPWARKNLADAIGQRRDKDAAPALITLLDSAKEGEVRLAIWKALARSAQLSEVPDMLSNLAKAGGDELREAEAAVVNAGKTENDAERRTVPVVQTYRANSGADDVQAALLRIMGKLAGPSGLSELTKALKNPNVKVRNAAAIALGEWPTGAPIVDLDEMLVAEKASGTRLNIITSIGNLAPLASDIPQGEIVQVLAAAYNATKDNREQVQVIAALGRLVDPTAVSALEEIASKEGRRKQLVDAAIKSVNEGLAKAITVAGATTLDIDRAQLTPGPLTRNGGAIINWLGLDDQVSWIVKVDEPGRYEVGLSQSFSASTAGRYAVMLGKDALVKNVEKTSGVSNFKTVTVGSATLPKAGYFRLWVRALEIAPQESLMRLKEVTLTKSGN